MRFLNFLCKQRAATLFLWTVRVCREKLSIVDGLFAGAAPIVARLAGLPRVFELISFMKSPSVCASALFCFELLSSTFAFQFDPFTLFIVCTAAHPRPPLLLTMLLVSASASAIDISSTPPLSGAILCRCDMVLIRRSFLCRSRRVV